MNSDQLTSLYAEIVNGVSKDRSRFADLPDFSATWDQVAAEVAEIRKQDPKAAFDVPSEVAG